MKEKETAAEETVIKLEHILGCLDRPTKGSYQLDGEEVATLDDARLAFTRNQ